MAKISKTLHMFVADQWIQGNAATPEVAEAACSHWFPRGVAKVQIGSKVEYFHGLTPSEVTQMLKGAGWYGHDAKLAQKALQGSEPDQVSVHKNTGYSTLIFVEGKNSIEILEYKKGNSPALLLLAAYRAEKKKKRQEAEKRFRDAAKAATFMQQYGASDALIQKRMEEAKHKPIHKLENLMPERGHAKSALSMAQMEAIIQHRPKLNTLLLHRDLANAMEAVNRVLHWGCYERQPPYPETGWKDVPLDKYKQALLRHQSEWLKDPASLDGESGKLHLTHMATNALILLQRWPEEGKDGSTDH